MIMETFTDNQKFESAKFCLDMTLTGVRALGGGSFGDGAFL